MLASWEPVVMYKTIWDTRKLYIMYGWSRALTLTKCLLISILSLLVAIQP